MKELSLNFEIQHLLQNIIQACSIFENVNLASCEILIFKMPKNASLKVASKIIGKNDLPDTFKYSFFPENSLYLLYLYWPLYFNLTLEQKIDVLFFQCMQTSAHFDGSMRFNYDKQPMEIRKIYRLFYTFFLKNYKKQLSSYSFLHYNAKDLTSRFKIKAYFSGLPQICKV